MFPALYTLFLNTFGRSSSSSFTTSLSIYFTTTKSLIDTGINAALKSVDLVNWEGTFLLSNRFDSASDGGARWMSIVL